MLMNYIKIGSYSVSRLFNFIFYSFNHGILILFV